jgi:hypothetical protein
MKKHSRNTIIILLLFCAMGINSQAQIKRPRILFGANASYFNPQKAFANQYKVGMGGEVSAGIGSNKTFLVATIGSSVFMPQDNNENGKLSYKPMQVGIRQFLLQKNFFVQGDLGTASIKDRVMGTTGNRFVRGVGAGVRIFGLEGGMFYNGWKNVDSKGFSNSVVLKIGWNKIL